MSAIKRSDGESQRSTDATKAGAWQLQHKTRPKQSSSITATAVTSSMPAAGSSGVQTGASGVRLGDETGAGADNNRAAPSPPPLPQLHAGRLVFGLSSRTNKLKHDGLTEQTGQMCTATHTREPHQQPQAQCQFQSQSQSQQPSQKQQQQQQQQQRLPTQQHHRTSSKVNETASSGANQAIGRHDAKSGANCDALPVSGSCVTVDHRNVVEQMRQQQPQSQPQPESRSQPQPQPHSLAHAQPTAAASMDKPARKLRASSYGNFYKPQDLTEASQTRETSHAQHTSSQRQPEAPKLAGAPQTGHSSQDNSSLATSRSQQVSAANASRCPTTLTTMTLRHSVAEQPEQSHCEHTDAPKAEPKPTLAPTAARPGGAQVQPEPALAPPRTRFNVLPPPQLTMATTGRGSVVSYAKSRIYDKPHKPHNDSNEPKHEHEHEHEHEQRVAPRTGPPSGATLTVLHYGSIPKSIVSGFKPPKVQVSVSKAREKWEGGEPFARTKSRQRLAAVQAKSKHLLPGVWSLTNVVATQQMQLQQAYASFSARATVQHQPHPSVKILQRGSVLERVQQFERAPSSPTSTSLSSGSARSSSCSISSAPPTHSSSGSSSSSSSSSGSEASDTACLSPVNIDPDCSPFKGAAYDCGEPATCERESVAELDLDSCALAANKLCRYRQRVACVQRRQQQQWQQVLVRARPQDSQAAGQLSQRRPSLRRRSSLSTSAPVIPRFYHPNGKPNTYELEQQRRNIAACFDQLPERRAQVRGPHHKRHFGMIARACGLAEYLREPLSSFVRHQLDTDAAVHMSGRLSRCASITGASAADSAPKLSATPGSLSAALTQTHSSTHEQRTAQSVYMPSFDGAPSNSPAKPQLVRAATIDDATQAGLSGTSGRTKRADARRSSTSAKSPPDQPATSNHRRQSTSKLTKCESATNAAQMAQYVTCEQFLVCWRKIVSSAYDTAAKFVYLLTLGDERRPYLVPDDFIGLVQSIIDDHPGLKFLRAAPDFHMRYIQTVIARIYFCANKSWTGKLTRQELRRSNLLAVLDVLGQEDDINQVTDYFSYEHFYVIYCKFWNLDQDHDLFISRDDLARHNDAAISARIIERIFAGVTSKQIQQTGKMSYSDFVWFLIAEEDKKHPRAIEYWFRLMDLDGDGYISMYEMEYFYYEQTKRLALMNIEALPFIDCACQLLDLINPREQNKISLADLKRTKLATVFFDTFINLEKYLEHESREFLSTRDIVQEGVVVSDWDRYAQDEYESLILEETSV